MPYAAAATPAQGYSLTLAPLTHHQTQWLIVRADERSDPNTVTATGVQPSMLREQRWWVLFDRAGRARCTVRLRAGDADTAEGARQRLRQACPAVPAVLRQRAAWSSVAAPVAAAPARITWTPRRVCADRKCVNARSTLHTVFDRAPPAGMLQTVRPAAARCVAAQWLIVTNLEPPQGSGEREGVAFRALPPPLPAEILGYEFVRIDGVAPRPRGLACV